MTEPAPEGARQALATGASTLLVVTVAFAAWWTFGTEADAGLVLGLAGPAFLALALVPALATRASLRLARWTYALGALLAVATLVAGFSQGFMEAADESDTDVPVRVDVHMVGRPAPALHPA